jgi:hydroxypyruvate isomerase
MMRLAPHLGLTSIHDGLFIHHAGADPLRQIEFIAERGFAGIEDNFLQLRPAEVQVRIGEALARNGLAMGCFLATLTLDRPTFGVDAFDMAEMLKSELQRAIETAKRVGGRSLTVILGRSRSGVPRELQLRHAVENLKQCAELAERADVVLLVEPISRARWADILVSRVDDALTLCREINSPAVRLLFDVYQCQRESGNLLETLDRAWPDVGAIQIADCPGRCEPGTGEINFENVLRHIRTKAWDGLIELEHAASIPGRVGEITVLEVCARLWDATGRTSSETV